MKILRNALATPFAVIWAFAACVEFVTGHVAEWAEGVVTRLTGESIE